MESFEEMKKLWDKNKAAKGLLERTSVEKVIKTRIAREKRIVVEYFWAAFIYHNMIYGFASFLIVKYWGDIELALMSLVCVALYIPFTVVLMRKFKVMCKVAVNKLTAEYDIYAHVKDQYTTLGHFFRIKKRFDWVAIPVSCFIMLAILFKLFAGGISEHPIGASVMYVTVLIMFAAAAYFENRKRFKEPLRKLRVVMEDIESQLKQN